MCVCCVLCYVHVFMLCVRVLVCACVCYVCVRLWGCVCARATCVYACVHPVCMSSYMPPQQPVQHAASRGLRGVVPVQVWGSGPVGAEDVQIAETLCLDHLEDGNTTQEISPERR